MKASITRSFRTPLMERASKDTKFRQHLLTEAVNALLAGDLGAGKALLRDYINATITFEGLAKELGNPSKSIHRMLGPRGNPRGRAFSGSLKFFKLMKMYNFK